MKIGGAFQGDDRAVEGDHHAQESAQHPQQHQQPHQIRCHRRAGQADEIGQVLGNGRQCPGQGGCGLAETQQFEGARDIDRTDDRRHGQRQWTGTDIPDANPGHGDQAHEKSRQKNRSIHC